MPTVTALRARSPGRVAVELDGAPWRVLPVDVLARTGIGEGRVLDRPALRLLRRELRRTEALRVATAALRYRDLSSRRLAERLARQDVTPREAGETLETLTRAGLVDDARLAHNRAERLAERGYGDAAIRHRLAADGLPPEAAAEALAGLGSETERAERIVRDRGAGPRTARYLSARGFGEEAVEAALGAGFGHEG